MLRTFSLALALSGCVLAASATPATTKTAAKKAISLVCPVTHDKIASVKDAAGKSVYKGKTYYFCCSSCKPEFDANPAKFAKAASAAKPTPSHKM